MTRLRPLFLATMPAAAGAVATVALSAALLGTEHTGELTIFLLAAVIVTAGLTTFMVRRLAGASMRVRLAAIAIFAALVGLVNVAILSTLMLVSHDDAVQVAILFVYAAAAATGAALATARESAETVDRLAVTARRLADGDLTARVGPLDSDPELAALGATLDEMASRLDTSLTRERAAETQRRDLITAVSHDLRTPLAGLRAMIEAIQDGVVEDPVTIRRYVDEMHGAVGSLVDLTNDLFELVQLDVGAIEAETARAGIEDIVASALAAVDAQATEKGLVLQTHLGGAGSAQYSPRLTRVIQNLLSNAIRHTPSDGSVIVEARQGDDGIELSVEDTGDGIAAEALDRVFEPFWRGDTARAGEGSGLGLALAKRITEALGGTIVVESQPSAGSRFAVKLPEPA